MKTYVVYGLAWSIAGAVMMIVLYLAGLHSSADKLGMAQGVGLVGGLGIAITCLTLGIKARRNEVPVTEEFGYGQALGAGVMITLFASLFGTVTAYCYPKFINPEFVDVIVESQTTKLEERGMRPAQIEEAEKVIRKISSPGVQAAFGFFGGMLFGTVISLIAAAFLKRPAVDLPVETPPLVT